MSVISIAEARKFLSASVTSPSIDDTVLQVVIDAAEDAIADRIGPFTVAPQVEIVLCTNGCGVLPIGPVAANAVTTATDPFGTVVPGSSFSVDPGKVMRYKNFAPMTNGPWTVTYNAGWTTTPPKALWATRELIRHLWESMRAQGTPVAQVGALAHSLTYRVEEMIDGLDVDVSLGIL